MPKNEWIHEFENERRNEYLNWQKKEWINEWVNELGKKELKDVWKDEI